MRAILAFLAAMLGAGPALAQPELRLRPDGHVAAPTMFPIGVWLQSPGTAPRWRQTGVNLLLAQFQPTTTAVLDQFRAQRLAIVDKPRGASAVAANRDVVQGLMHMDEPDNRQPLPGGGWGDCIPVAETLAQGRALREAAAGRPVLLNFGQGAARDDWEGQGPSCRGEAYYRAAAEAADIISFDVYPVANVRGPLAGRLELVPQGVARMLAWSGGRKPVWAILETGPIHNARIGPSPAEVRAQFWMAIIAGARGIIWFAHGGEPFRSTMLLENPLMVATVSALNRRALALAPVLNAPPPTAPPARVTGEDIAVFQRRHEGMAYILLANHARERRSLELELPGGTTLQPIEGGAEVALQAGRHREELEPYGIRLWRVPLSAPGGRRR
ncbi:MAG: hypothetical protein K2X11_08930 [Acetobacteraceae bacterium]|nr:hypothetical protein [Acetobacteraceae bacterium]